MRAAGCIFGGVLIWVIVFGATFAHGAQEALAAQTVRHVSFIPQWQPQAQFAGYYVAREKGFYRDHGLEVSILQGGPDRPSEELLRTGAVQFGTLFLSTALLERSRGSRLINLAQVVQKSSQLLIARHSSGIQRLEQIDGRKVGLWAAELSVLPLALFRKQGVHPAIIPQSSTVNLFLRGGVDVVSAMWYNEYHTILNAGVDPEELVVFRLSDSMNFPEDGIYCLEETFKADPNLCCRFAQASLEGWRYALDHPEEALDIVMKHVDAAQIPTNRVHQRWMLRCMRDLIGPSRPGATVGVLTESDYTAVASELRSCGLIDDFPPITDFRKDCVATHEK